MNDETGTGGFADYLRWFHGEYASISTPRDEGIC
jgi:hypothetical protein